MSINFDVQHHHQDSDKIVNNSLYHSLKRKNIGLLLKY